MLKNWIHQSLKCGKSIGHHQVFKVARMSSESSFVNISCIHSNLKEMLEEMYCLSESIIKCNCLLFAIVFCFTLALFCCVILFIQFRNIFSVYAFHYLHYVIRIIWYWTSFLQDFLCLKIARCYISLKERSQAILFHSKGKVLFLIRMVFR